MNDGNYGNYNNNNYNGGYDSFNDGKRGNGGTTILIIIFALILIVGGYLLFFKDKDKQVFYCSLYPSKIADYLDEAQNRHNEKSINIPFSKLDSTPEALYVAAKQFSEESAKQGSGSNPLVKDRIRKQDFDKIKS